MEPQMSAPGPSVEVGRSSGEASRPSERQLNGAAEVVPRPELGEKPSAGPAQPAPQLPTLPAPQPSQTPGIVATSPVAVNDNPLTANDDDLIEKEWVQKAKKIVTQTRNDPYLQEKEVSKLQADYMKKRYGKDIKVASD